MTACNSQDIGQNQGSVKQEVQKENKKETDSVKEVNMDNIVALFDEKAHEENVMFENLDEIRNSCLKSAGYESGEKWRLTGIMKEQPAWNVSFSLISEKYGKRDDIWGEFLCSNSRNSHIFVKPGTPVVVEGTLSEQGFLQNCIFVNPNLENLSFEPNISEVIATAENQIQVVEGTIKEIKLVGLSDAEREQLDFEHSEYDLARTTSHVGVLTDGNNDINFYISQNNNENLKTGDKIAVRGKVLKEGDEIFMYCGDAVYIFE